MISLDTHWKLVFVLYTKIAPMCGGFDQGWYPPVSCKKEIKSLTLHRASLGHHLEGLLKFLERFSSIVTIPGEGVIMTRIPGDEICAGDAGLPACGGCTPEDKEIAPMLLYSVMSHQMFYRKSFITLQKPICT